MPTIMERLDADLKAAMKAKDAERLACVDCGTGCCPACAIHLESTAYCRTCAGSLLGTPVVRASSPLVLH